MTSAPGGKRTAAAWATSAGDGMSRRGAAAKRPETAKPRTRTSGCRSRTASLMVTETGYDASACMVPPYLFRP